MNEMNENSKTYLRELENLELDVQLWKRLKDTPCEGSLWKKDQEEPYRVDFNYSLSHKSHQQYLYLSIDKTYAEIVRDKYLGSIVFVKLKFSEEHQVFTNGELDWDSNHNSFRLNTRGPYYITTKRTSCRYTTGGGDRIEMSFGNHVFPCFDISSGGSSILITKGAVSGMSKGALFENVVLKYNSKKFEIPRMTVVNLIENKDNPDLIKIAFKFNGLRVETEDAIWVEVNNSVRRYVGINE